MMELCIDRHLCLGLVCSAFIRENPTFFYIPYNNYFLDNKYKIRQKSKTDLLIS